MDTNQKDSVGLHFGATRWELTATNRIASFGSTEPPVEDLAAAVSVALSNPLDFPALDQAVVPGDQVALVVDASTPEMPQLVRCVIAWFEKRGTPLSNMRIVLAAENDLAEAELRAALSQAEMDLAIETHDCDSTGSIAYVAANEASDPIYLNRTLVDADVIVPILCARSVASLDYFGGFSLYPLLSDRGTRGKFYSLPRLEDAGEREALRAWADQAAWWVGLVFAIQVVPAGDNRIGQVIAGTLEAVEGASQPAMASGWAEPPGVSDLTIALLDGTPSQQTWLAAARALYNARRCAGQSGVIALCTNLQDRLGKALERLRQRRTSVEVTAKKLAADSADDAIAAAVILDVTMDHHVYLVSELRPDAVEGLGLGVISEKSQLVKLLDAHRSCAVLDSAQHHVCGLAASASTRELA